MNLWPIPIELFFWKDFMPSILQSLDFSILDWNCNNTNRCRPKNLRPVVLASAILAIKSSFWLFFAIFVPSLLELWIMKSNYLPGQQQEALLPNYVPSFLDLTTLLFLHWLFWFQERSTCSRWQGRQKEQCTWTPDTSWKKQVRFSAN